jgi:Tfp pilus tip-associated adhesin PilY1
VDEIVFFTTFIPDVDICTGSGDAYLFVVDYNSGLAPSHPVFDINADGIIDENDKIDDGNGNMITPVGMYIGRGTPSRPVVFKDTIFVTLSAPASTGNNGLFHTKWGPRKAPRVESWKQH